MKPNTPSKLIVSLVTVAVIAVAGVAIAGADDTSTQLVTSSFKVEGMTCGGCEAGVKMKVKKLDGVDSVEASYKDGTADVTYDPTQLGPEQIIAAIEDLGYTAELQETRTS